MLLTVVLADVVPLVDPVVRIENNFVVVYTDSCTPFVISVLVEVK